MRPIFFAANLLVFLLAVSIARAEDTSEKPAKKTVRLANLTLKGSYPEGTSAPGLFGEIAPHLSDLLARIDKAAKDDKINGLILDLRLGEVSFSTVEEIRAAIGRVRSANKKVYGVVRSATNRDYLVAAACDEICMP